jgi:prepilin-type N-terminal cleavage/methylation domain-containing protein
MFKALVKKSRENKGFSLIELIVVIAILAILALILVPRFTGFTNDAREAADEATSRTIETAVMSLLANGDLKGVGTITITAVSDTSSTSTISYGAGLTGDEDELEAMIGTNIRSETKTGFTVTVPANGEVVCEPDNVPAVPAGGSGG